MTDISETDIQSYIDRRTDHDSWVRVEEYLARRPDEAARVRQARNDTDLLCRYFDTLEAQIPDQHIAETTRLIVEHEPRRRFAGLSGGLRVAAMGAFLLVCSAAVLGIKLSMTVPAYADAAALAYQNVAKELVAGEEDISPDPQALIDWLNEKTGLVIRVPHSEARGLSLTDGRLTSFDRHAAGLLVYEDWRKHRVVVFVTRVADGDDPVPHHAFDRSTYIDYWSRNGVGIVVAAADDGDLRDFMKAAQESIDVAPAALLPR